MDDLTRSGHELATGTSTDDEFVVLWLKQFSSPHTREAYGRDIARFRAFVRRPLAILRMQDVVNWQDSLEGAPASIGRRIAAVKSLLKFGHETGLFPVDAGRAVHAPKFAPGLAKRILTVAEVLDLIRGARWHRDETLLELLYVTGIRVSELCGLSWEDLQPRESGGQITVFGKGGKERTLLVPPGLWARIVQMQAFFPGPDGAEPSDPVFVTRTGRRMTRVDVLRVVKAAAKRAGIKKPVSPHWLRHCHASHALDRGAPVHWLKETLGHASLQATERYTHARPDHCTSSYVPGPSG